LNLLEVPHFGCSLEINVCVNILLNCVHGGTLCLDPPMSIYTSLIAWITGLPKIGEDSTTLFNKAGEKALSEAMKEKFHTFRGERGLDFMNINDEYVWFTMHVLACKIFQKCHKDEVSAAVIVVAEKCSERGPNELGHILDESIFYRLYRGPEKGTKFHYACLLIFIL
jgi:hypothetical protein